MLYSIYEINEEKLESVSLKQFLTIKKENPDCIILFQIGRFYLALLDDAKIVSEITGLVLGSRNFAGAGEIVQCGAPIDSDINSYIKQLLENNYKVCLCKEFLDESNERYRKIIRTYTTGTIIESQMLETHENNFILAVCKNKDKYSLSYADVSTGQFYQTEGDLSEIKLEIDKIEPCEILISENIKDDLKKEITKYCTTILKFEGNIKYAKTYIEKYCEKTQKNFLSKLDEVVDYKINNFLSMDEITRHCLELTRTRRHLKKKGSIFWFLNYAKTPMGARLLKKYLSEPLLSTDKIIQRQEAIKELIQDKKLLISFEEAMCKFCDLSRGCANISNQTILPKDLLAIAQNSRTLEQLESLCNYTKSSLLKLNEESIKDTIAFTKEIICAINENSPKEVTQGGIINDGYCANLDYLRSELNKVEKNAIKFQESEKNRLNIKNLKVIRSSTLGFYLEVSSANSHKISNSYIKKQTLANCTRYTNDKLEELEKNYSSLKTKIDSLEYEIFREIRQKATEFVDVIRNIAKDIAQIDVLVSFARCAWDNNLVCPVFNENGIYIKDGFHPSLIKLHNKIIKNDTELNNGEMIILTGANMSGKSTYLKYNAIIALLAQIGSFVPAESANLTILDKIFVRQGSTDDIINNNSSFMVEMLDLKFIINNITDSSFVLLDEPAKSTSALEGGAIARAFCEYLIKNYQAKTMIATHNLELTKVENTYPNKALNYVIGNPDVSESIINDRKIKRGCASSSSAINTATLADIPEEIIELARKYVK